MATVTPRLTLYSRPGCHLCEEMKGTIFAAAGKGSFHLEEVNIDGDPELKRLYGESIPVLAINGRIAFKVRLSKERFLEKFRRIALEEA